MVALLVYAGIALGVSFYCSLAEAALLSMTPFYVQTASRRGRRSANLLFYLDKNMRSALAAILSLNTIAHTRWCGWCRRVGRRNLRKRLGRRRIGRDDNSDSGGVGDHPKDNRRGFMANTRAGAGSFGLDPDQGVVSPGLLVRKVDVVSSHGQPLGSFLREELAAMAELGVKEGVLASKELRVVKNLVRFHVIRVDSIMTPRTVTFALDESLTVGETMQRHPEIAYSRIPLYGKISTM